MEKEFVSYEIALDLEGIGFEEMCISVFLTSTNKPYPMYRPYTKKEQTDELLRPTVSQAFRWFREKHGLCHFINFSGDGFCSGWEDKGFNEHGFENFKTYEEAELECLKKLITIVKEKL